MSKSNNSHKILKSVALAGALTAAGTVATTTAHADTTTTNAAPSQAPASANTADQQLANLKSQQTANENTVAQNNQATMTSATNAANGQIADLNAQIQQRQASNAAANQAKVASETAQVNAAASSATDQENAAYSAAVASQQAANDTALKSAQANIVTPAQKAQQTAQENASYQNKAGNLNIAHNQNLNKIDADAASQTKAVNDQITKVQNQIKVNHQKAIDNATKQVDGQIADAQKSVNNAQRAVTSDQTAVNSAKTVNDQAQQASQNAQKTLTQDQNSLKSLQDGQDVVQTVKINKDQWYHAYNDWYTTGGYKGGSITNADAQALINMRYKENSYKHSTKNQKETVDPDNLTDSQLKEINIFGANILNQIRTQLGLPEVRVTQGSINFAKDIATNYKNDNWDSANGHYDAGIERAAKQNGLLDSGNYYECLGGNYDIENMDDLKEMVYNDILGMTMGSINPDGSGNGNLDGHGGSRIGVEFAHANGLLGYPHSNPNGYREDFALATNIHGYVYDHLITVPTDSAHRYYWTDPAKYDHTNIPLDQSSVAKQISQLQTKVANDQVAVNATKSKADTTAQALMSAQAKLANDQKALKTAQDKLASLKANRAQMIAKLSTPEENSAVQKLQAKIKDIKASHDKAIKAENAKYNAELDKLTKAHQAKLDAIKAQPSDVNGLKAQLQKKLDTLKANHEAKLAQIQKDADAKIAKIKADTQIDPEIAKLQDRIATIKANLAAQKKSLDDQYAALVASDQAAYQKLENQLKPSASEEAAKGENDSYTTSDGKTVVLPHESTTTNGKTVVLPHETGEAQTTVSANHNAVTRPEVATTTPIATVNTTTPTTREEVKAQREGKLPQTGNQSALAAIVLGAASAMFGFGLAAKKRY